ncbi:MraY family glycosyltransferase [Psychroserpens sp. AS72]|uniref:glycosyltransferase family 4 protein n=1 Tax=Psychroserpens sp. AS72 TaxID=3135775 RepID=UPI0031734137
MIQELLKNFNPIDYLELWLLLAFSIAFIVSLTSFPAIFNVAIAKELMDEPDHRSVHDRKTATLGGVGIFISLAVVITSIGALLDTKILLLVLGSMTILFFLGLKDDLLILSPRKKFIGQLLAASLLILFTDTRILGLSGVFGITILPYWFSVLFTLFVYVLIINAYNLIDGVDGLAGCLAVAGFASFAFLFIKTGDITMSTLTVGGIGAIIPFLRLNFSKRKKIFMGDTGSMIVGFLIAFCSVRFINTTELNPKSVFFESAPVLALAIAFFPLLDTLRVFIIRPVLMKKSPFTADQNHIHHRFLKLGFSHAQTTIYIVILNLLLIAFVYHIGHLDTILQFLLMVLVGTFLYSSLFIYNWLIMKKWIPESLNNKLD